MYVNQKVLSLTQKKTHLMATFQKIRKTYLDFWLNFCAAETHSV